MAGQGRGSLHGERGESAQIDGARKAGDLQSLLGGKRPLGMQIEP